MIAPYCGFEVSRGWIGYSPSPKSELGMGRRWIARGSRRHSCLAMGGADDSSVSMRSPVVSVCRGYERLRSKVGS